MAVQWNEFFIFSLRRFARFKTDWPHLFKNIWLAAFFLLFFLKFKLEVIYNVDGYTRISFP